MTSDKATEVAIRLGDSTNTREDIAYAATRIARIVNSHEQAVALAKAVAEIDGPGGDALRKMARDYLRAVGSENEL